MRTRKVAAVVSLAAVGAALLLVLFPSGESSPSPAPEVSAGGTSRAAAAPAAATRFRGAREDCSTRSEASFPGAFTSSRNLVVGPLVLVGGAYTPASTVRDFGGNKFPLLVEAGHTVTVRLPARARRSAGLAYGPLPQGENTLSDTYHTVTFVACPPGKPTAQYRPDGPSGSYADGVAVTFWSGFVLTKRPSCVPLAVYVDDEPSPRRAELPLGRRCGH